MQAERTGYVVACWGAGELWTGGGLVLAHDFHFGRLPDEPDRDANGLVSTESCRPRRGLDTCELVSRFGAFLAGEPVAFDDVPLEQRSCTSFQLAVTAALRRVPRGEVVSYGELAALAGYPGAARAVGTFCARNRFAFLVPCHRVVAAHGVGPYGSAGTATKRRLLALEGVVL